MKKTILYLTVALTLLSCHKHKTEPSAEPTQEPTAQIEPQQKEIVVKDEKIFAAQIFCLPPKDRIDDFFARLKSNGFNTVIVRAFHNPGDRLHGAPDIKLTRAGVYFKTPRAPLIEDILPDVCERAHRANLRIFAWMTSREITWDFPDKNSLLEYQYDFRAGTIANGRGLDIFNPAVSSYLESLYSDLARLPVDGILFQDDLVLRHNVGFGRFAEAEFFGRAGEKLRPEALYGKIDLSGERPRVEYSDLFFKWARLKSERILALALRLRERVKTENPSAEIAMNVYYDSVLMPDKGLIWLSQDIENWLSSPIEYFAVMAYHRQIAQELSLADWSGTKNKLLAMKERIYEWTSNDGEKIIWKIQARDWKTGEFIPKDEINKVSALFDDMASGTAIAPVEEDF